MGRAGVYAGASLGHVRHATSPKLGKPRGRNTSRCPYEGTKSVNRRGQKLGRGARRKRQKPLDRIDVFGAPEARQPNGHRAISPLQPAQRDRRFGDHAACARLRGQLDGAMVLFGQRANLLSVGAIDFGLIVVATVILVEDVFRRFALAAAAWQRGGPCADMAAFGGLTGELASIPPSFLPPRSSSPFRAAMHLSENLVWCADQTLFIAEPAPSDATGRISAPRQ